MPDITMCKDGSCPVRRHCYRFSAKATPQRQSYFMGSPRGDDEDACDHYMPTEVGDDVAEECSYDDL